MPAQTRPPSAGESPSAGQRSSPTGARAPIIHRWRESRAVAIAIRSLGFMGKWNECRHRGHLAVHEVTAVGNWQTVGRIDGALPEALRQARQIVAAAQMFEH